MIGPEVLDRLKDLAVGVVLVAVGLGVVVVASASVAAKIWVLRKSRPPRAAEPGEPIATPKKEFY
jgi:hypothetical protein